MNIIVDLNYPIQDGTEVKFRSPADCSEVTGLKVYYPDGSKEFVLADAHGNNVGDIDHLFAEDVVVKVILDVTNGMAFVQNADTNAYIERTFVKSVNGAKPDENGNVTVAGGGGGGDTTALEKQIADIEAEIGNPKDVASLYLVELRGSLYITENGDWITQDGVDLWEYSSLSEENQKFFGETVKIKTYIYGDMAVEHGINGYSDGVMRYANSQADIEADPESGVFECEAVFNSGDIIYVSFCLNPYLPKPEVYVKQGSVWQEIGALKQKAEADKDEIVAEVIAALPVYNGEVV